MDDDGSQITPFKDFFVEVQSVLDWFSLGLHLGVPVHELRRIEREFQNQLQRQQIDSLDYWYKNAESPSFEQLGKALLNVNGYEYVGERILNRHCNHRRHDPAPLQANGSLILPSSSSPITGTNTSSNNSTPTCAGSLAESSGSQERHPSIPSHIVPRKPLGPLVSRGGEFTDVPHIPVIKPPTHHHTNPVSLSSAIHATSLQSPPTSHTTTEGDSLLSTYPGSSHGHHGIPQYGIPDHDNNHLVRNHHIRSDLIRNHKPIRQGQQLVNISNPTQSLSVGDALSVSSSVFNGPHPPPVRACYRYNRNGALQSIPQSNLMRFLPFDPSPNPIQPPSIQSDQSQQIVPDTSSLAEDELKQFSFDFKNLVIDARDALIEGNVKGRKLKAYLCDIVRGKVPEECQTLKTELSKISREPTVHEVFDILLEFLNYDCYRLLNRVVNKFLSKSPLADRIAKYQKDFKSFRQWCNLGAMANAHQHVYPSPTHHYSDTTVSLHLNDSWQQRTHSQLDGLLDCEFGSQHVQDFHMVHIEKHSILAVWETTYTVVNELCVNCIKRFSHLGKQGVLQLLIGRYQLDFTMDSSQPMLYYLKLKATSVINEDRMSSSTSDQSLYTHGSIKTGHISHSTNESGYDSTSSSSRATRGSGPTPPVKLPEYTVSDPVLEKCPSKEIQSRYKSDLPRHLSVEKGEMVRVRYEKDGWAEVVNSQKQYGYIPSSVLLKGASSVTGSHSDITKSLAQPDAHSTISSETQSTYLHCYDIILQEVTNSDQPSSDDILPLSDTQHEDIARPDTPPLVGTMNGLEISLSEDKNSVMAEEDGMEKKSPRHEKKRFKLNLIKDMETRSLTKSLRVDLNKLKHDDDDDLPPTLLQKLKNFVRPAQRKDSASVGHRRRKFSYVHVLDASSTLVCGPEELYLSLPILDNALNSSPRHV